MLLIQQPPSNPPPVRRQKTIGQIEGSCSANLPHPFSDVVAAHVFCAKSIASQNFVEAYASLVPIVPVFVDVFRKEEEAWLVSPLHSLVHNIRLVAEKADAELDQKGKKPEKLENAGNQLMSCFSAANRPGGSGEKRRATLRIVNELFRIYFRLNTLRNCKYLIRVVDAKNFVPFHQFPSADRVTYKFFVGRLSVFDENFVEADRHLTYAFNHCHSGSKGNRRLILKYLIPVKTLVGQVPSEELLRTYQLQAMYAGVISSMKAGSVRQFEQALEDNMEEFIKTGTYLLIEKLRLAVYRRLFKRVQLIHASMNPDKAVQVPLGHFLAALAWEGHQTDLDEVECVVANMIYRRYVRAKDPTGIARVRMRSI